MIGSVTFFVATMLAEAATPAPTAAAPNPQDKVICRRYLETGSLVKATKVCHKRSEWARIIDANRNNAEDLQTAKNGLQSN